MSMRNTPIAFGFFLCAFALFAGDAATELKKLEGATWAFVAAQKGGEKAPDEVLKFTATFAGDKMTIESNDPAKKERKIEFAIKLDPTKDPKEIDFLKLPDKNERTLGIYKLSGDEFTFCMPDDKDAPRPKEFASPQGTRIMLITLKKK
jgi:uncharacterized protein (TIGR03067 family)